MTTAQAVSPTQGGAGTIDPNTVAIHELFRYTLAADTDELHHPVAFVTDSAGERILGSVLQRPGTANGAPQYNPPRSVVTKFTAAGVVEWARERQVSSVTGTDPSTGQTTTTYYERFSDDQTPVEIDSYEGSCAVQLVALTVDAQNNVFAGFDVIYASTNGGTINIADTPITLIVKFAPTGQFLWRRSTVNVSDSRMADASRLMKLDVASDGSVAALISNFQSNDRRLQQTVLAKYAADGTKVTFNHYGLGDDRSIEFESSPLALTQDGNQNIFLITNESPDPFTNPTPDKIVNVIRKLTPSGDLSVRKDVAVYPNYAANNSDFTLDGWIDGKADSTGNLYIAGSHFRGASGGFQSSDEGESNELVLKFAPDLTQLWRTLGPQPKRTLANENQAGSGANVLRISSVGVTIGGNVTHTGVGASENDDFWEITRYSLDDGHLIWHRLYQGPQADPSLGFTDTLSAMDLDTDGNVFAAGGASFSGATQQAVIKYSKDGDLQFVKLLSGAQLQLQTSTLSVPGATNRPTFYGNDLNTPKQAVAIDLDSPAVVAAVGSLANISTRVRVGGNDNALIGGTIITGPSGKTKKVLVRAIGPSLTTAGVSGALPDTTLEVHDSAGHVYTNDNWKTGDPGQPSQQSEIEATGVAPTNELESALVATIPTGGATAIVRGKGGATGVGLVEVYDLEAGSVTDVANISTRGVVETDENVMIGGIIILAPNPSRVYVRAIGPSLTAQGVPNALQDPELELRDVNGNLVVSNDDWQTRDLSGVSQQTEIEATTIPPTDPHESAAKVTLDPGNYTAIVRGKGGTTGVALVEVYRLP